MTWSRMLIALALVLLLAAGLPTDAAAAATPPLDSPSLGCLGIGPSMDVEFQNGVLYAIGEGTLRVVEVSDPARPIVRGTIDGLGRVRQLCVDGSVAYVTSREDGLYLVDVSSPEKMRILAHYDTIELATGIAVSGSVAFVACRTAGVELVDVRTPEKPAHLSTVRTGEAQSICVRNGLLYVGVWGSAELVICDVSNPHQPAVLSRSSLDGYGDGVDVRGNYCYVATGHHAKSLPHAKPQDPGYGRGHGLEILDISSPQKPAFVGRVKFPPFYRLGMDMWDVKVTDRCALVADTHNGAFVVDIADPANPRTIAHHRLPFMNGHKDASPAAGLALGRGTVFVAGAWSDVHTFPWDMSSTGQQAEKDTPLTVGPSPSFTADPRFRTYAPPGQVHAVDFDGEVAFVACGNAGLHSIEISPDIRPLATRPTDGFALGVAASGGRVYVAEGEGGLSIWNHRGAGQLEPLGRYRVPGDSVRQVVVAGKYALLHVGPGTLHIVDVSEPSEPSLARPDSRLGLFYYNPISPGLLGDRYACCHWHVTGLYWYDLSGELPRWTGHNYPFRIDSRNGAAFLTEQALVTCGGGYTLMSVEEQRSLDKLDIRRIPGQIFHGKPTVAGDRLYVSDRYTGVVTAIDIGNLEKPQFIDRLELKEHPGLIVVHNGTPIIPAGYQGLLVWDKCGAR